MSVPLDNGPIYRETFAAIFPVEPFNTYSNLIFLIVALYFAVRTRLDFRQYPLIVFSLPLLLVGFVGGSLYHATRADRLWLVMDFMPIIVLTLAAGYFFLRQFFGMLTAYAFMLGGFLLICRLYHFLPKSGAYFFFGYSLLAAQIFLPALIHAAKKGWANSASLFAALAAFAAAITFRQLDSALPADLFPMGTHFLWHILGGISVYSLMLHISKIEESLAPASARAGSMSTLTLPKRL